MTRVWVLLILAFTVGEGCAEPPAPPQAAPPGTLETASRLTLGLFAYYDKSSSGIKLCLNSSGTCVTEVTTGQVDCHSYAGAEITVGGTPIPQREPGGFAMALDQPGCTYPIFEADSIQDLLTHGGGPVQVTLRIGSDSVSLTVDDLLVQRQLKLPGGALVGGTDAFATLEPRPAVLTDRILYFDYDLEDLNDQWCFAKNGYHGSDVTLAPLPVAAWNAQGFSFGVPKNMPAGTGKLGVSDGLQVSATPCPFVECIIQVNTDAELAGVQVTQP